MNSSHSLEREGGWRQFREMGRGSRGFAYEDDRGTLGTAFNCINYWTDLLVLSPDVLILLFFDVNVRDANLLSRGVFCSVCSNPAMVCMLAQDPENTSSKRHVVFL